MNRKTVYQYIKSVPGVSAFAISSYFKAEGKEKHNRVWLASLYCECLFKQGLISTPFPGQKYYITNKRFY